MIYVATGLDLRKVIAVLKLLTSNRDGEVLAAAAALNRMLTTASTTWDELLSPHPQPPPVQADAGLTDRELLLRAQSHDWRLNPWESDFLRDISQRIYRGYTLSAKTAGEARTDRLQMTEKTMMSTASLLETDFELVKREMRKILRQTTHLPQTALAIYLAEIGLQGIKKMTGRPDAVISFAQAVAAADDPSRPLRTQGCRDAKAQAIAEVPHEVCNG